MSFFILDKFTTHLKNVIKQAAALAVELKHNELRPEHLLYGLAKQKGSIGTEILVKSGLTAEALKEEVIQHNTSRPLAEGEVRQEPTLSDQAKRALERAVLIANQYEHKYIGTEHLLASLLKLDSPTIAEIFRNHRTTMTELQQHLIVVLKNTSKFPDLTNLFDQTREGTEDDEVVTQGGGPLPTKFKERGNALDFFTTNLTDPQFADAVDPVIGRNKEIERVLHILSRRTKNNPVLVGDPGVGKTAIVEGLAKRILAGDVPDAVLGKRILSLDLSLVVAGTVYRGEFEGRVKQIIDEVKADPNTVLFIDELHTIIGAGGATGALDAANILKPALAKGQLRCIGATTLDEYRKHIESDPALERRFQPVIIHEPSPEETVEVLRGIKENYERYHRVGITEGAINAATRLSVRYLQEKFLPDKAIDLIDEAAAKVRLGVKGDPATQRIRQLEDELAALRDKKQAAVAREEFSHALAMKEQEDRVQQKVRRLYEQQEKSGKQLLGKIEEKDIADVVARMTGVPVGTILEAEQRKLLGLEKQMRQHIVGQDEAIAIIADAVRRSRTGLSSPHRPLGSFIFLGPSGVGKTETAKVLARTVFGDEDALVQIDMSEFSESFQTSKLIGAPAGYVGYKEGGKLTDGVRRRPYAVVLFDEIEKAHPDVFNLLLQILDEGHLTDAVGRKVNFKNTIVILTSNIGLMELNKQAAIGFVRPEKEAAHTAAFEQLEQRILGELKEQFRPELLNRIDRTIVFKPLMPKHLETIAGLALDEVRGRLKERGIGLQAGKDVRTFIARKGTSPEEGARGIRHVVQEDVESPIAAYLLDSHVRPMKAIVLKAGKDRILIHHT